MRKKVKCYLVFTSLFYRIIMYCLLPLILLGTAFALGCSMGKIALIVIAAPIPLIETVTDNWLFGGLHSKDAEKLDYLKTSGRGMAIIRNALSMDLFRKLLAAAGTLTITCLIVLWRGNGQADQTLIQIWIYGIVLSWFYSVLGTFIARFGGLLWFNLLVGYLMTLLESICWFVPGPLSFWPANALIFAALGVGASVLTMKIAMKKMEGSYYDQ